MDGPFGKLEPPRLDPMLLEILVCPISKGPVEYDSLSQELISRRAGLAYPIRDGLPMMLPEEARRLTPAEVKGEWPSLGIGRIDFAVSSIIIPASKKVSEGVLVSSTSVVWLEIIKNLQTDWSLAYKIPPRKWEEIIAGAFDRAGFDEVILTPRSGDYGRDVIAIRHGVGCIKIINSVKAFAPGNLVPYDDIRALLGVLSGEQDASKGIITTTSGFPPRIAKDPFIAPFLPTRLELMDGEALRKWLRHLAEHHPK
jgi:restriction system protein